MRHQAVNRDDIPSDYTEMMKTEQHHNHEIIRDDKGVLRWKEDPFIRRFVDGCNLNHVVGGLHSKGNGKDSEVYRELYRNMGYSLSGYWEMNNEDAAEYNPTKD